MGRLGIQAADDEKKQGNKYRSFLNRMRDHLSAEGVVFDELDANQYNWSGYNSHDERLASAIGLKKHIEAVLTKDYEKHGRDYYDGVYVIAHSHGGTIARLAMNLWDKDHDHYKADKDELRHDDHCPHCKQERHGVVGPNSVDRPTRVITLGSPFVTFEPRKGGLLSAQIAVWVFRVVTSVPFLVYFAVLLVAPRYDEGYRGQDRGRPAVAISPAGDGDGIAAGLAVGCSTGCSPAICRDGSYWRSSAGASRPTS